MTPEEQAKLKGMIRVKRFYDEDPETGKMREWRYVLEQFDGWAWREVPVLLEFKEMPQGD